MGRNDRQAESGAASSPAASDLVVRGRWLALCVLAIVYMLNWMDRQILSVLIEPIRKEMHFTDTQIGLLTGTLFAIFYSFVTVPVALLADRYSRIRIVASACFLWSLFSGFSGFATSFLHFAIARVGVAFGEAGGVAPSLSIVSDYFPPRQRVLAVALLTSASPFGILLGTMGGGLIAAVYGWRVTFMIAGALGIIMTPILLTLVTEPRRGRFEAVQTADRSRPSLSKTFALFFQLPSLMWLAISSGLFAMVGNGLLVWMPSLLMRHFGVPIHEVALYYGPMVGVALIVGAWASGFLVNWAGKFSIGMFALVPAGALALAAPLFVVALMSHDFHTILIWLFVPVALINMALAPTLSLVQNLTPPQVRSTASALLMLVLNLVGVGAGPLLVGSVSDALLPTFGADSLRIAMMTVLPPVSVLAAIAFCMVSRHLAADHDRVARGNVG